MDRRVRVHAAPLTLPPWGLFGETRGKIVEEHAFVIVKVEHLGNVKSSQVSKSVAGASAFGSSAMIPSLPVFTIGSIEFCGVVVWVERYDATKLSLHGCARWLQSFSPFGNNNTDWLAKMIYIAGHLCFPFRVSV